MILPNFILKSVIILILHVAIAARAGQEQYLRERTMMVQTQIVERGVRDTSVLRALRTVPRHLFVPAEQQQNAYQDSPLPIGYNQTISQPYIVALMTELIKPQPYFRVLEVGTGSGYQAAVLAALVDSVFSIELLPELATSAATRLKRLNIRNVVVRQGDGYQGWREHAPYDAILVTAAADEVPAALIDQLKEGGRMIIPVGSAGSVQELMLIEKKGKKVVSTSIIPVRFVPLIHPRK
ncbi:MAG: protein-L-isoaspartate(D-aspartate) O-methyltransferase [bacterium]